MGGDQHISEFESEYAEVRPSGTLKSSKIILLHFHITSLLFKWKKKLLKSLKSSASTYLQNDNNKSGALKSSKIISLNFTLPSMTNFQLESPYLNASFWFTLFFYIIFQTNCLNAGEPSLLVHFNQLLHYWRYVNYRPISLDSVPNIAPNKQQTQQPFYKPCSNNYYGVVRFKKSNSQK